MPSTPGRDLVAKFLLACSSCFLTLLVAEVGLRLIEPERSRMFRFNSRSIYELTPGTHRTFTHREGNGGHTIQTSINSEGFRGEELGTDWDRRVVVYGDSFIQAEFAVLAETFTEQLEGRLARACPWSTEVVNAGVIGYGPDQILRKLEDELPRLSPDLVVVSVFADNDLGDLLRNKIFMLTPDGQLQENSLEISSSLARSLGKKRDLALVGRARKAYWRWLAWKREASLHPAVPQGDEPIVSTRQSGHIEQWFKDTQEEFDSFVRKGDRVVRRIDYDHYDADVSLMPDLQSSRYKIRLMEQVLARIATLLREASVDALLLAIPSPIDICENYDYSVDESSYPGYDRFALTRAVEKGARAGGLPLVSLWDAFESNEPASLYYHYGDNHWNHRGQALAAEVVAKKIARLHWPECERTLDTNASQMHR